VYIFCCVSFHGGETGQLGDGLEQFLLMVVKGADLVMDLRSLRCFDFLCVLVWVKEDNFLVAEYDEDNRKVVKLGREICVRVLDLSCTKTLV
jgi:hypothetical protein